MRAAALAVAVSVVVVLALAACTGSPASSDPVKRGSLSADTGPAAATAPVVQFPRQVSIVLTEQQSRGLVSLPWRLVQVGPAGASLNIGYIAGGGCTHWRGIEVVETSSSVAVAALADNTSTSPAQTCTADLRIGATTVALTAPLGDRTLLHAHVDPSWASYAQDLG
jgi:hypothetical protein